MTDEEEISCGDWTSGNSSLIESWSPTLLIAKNFQESSSQSSPASWSLPPLPPQNLKRTAKVYSGQPRNVFRQPVLSSTPIGSPVYKGQIPCSMADLPSRSSCCNGSCVKGEKPPTLRFESEISSKESNNSSGSWDDECSKENHVDGNNNGCIQSCRCAGNNGKKCMAELILVSSSEKVPKQRPEKVSELCDPHNNKYKPLVGETPKKAAESTDLSSLQRRFNESEPGMDNSLATLVSKYTEKCKPRWNNMRLESDVSMGKIEVSDESMEDNLVSYTYPCSAKYCFW